MFVPKLCLFPNCVCSQTVFVPKLCLFPNCVCSRDCVVLLVIHVDGRSSGPKRLADLGRCTSVYEVIDPAREYVEDISGKVMRHMDSVSIASNGVMG